MDEFRKSLIKSTLRKVLKRLHYPLEVMLLCVRWHAAYPLSFRQIVDREGQAIDFLLTAKRALAAARRFFERAIGQHDLPDSITIDKSGANTAAIVSIINSTGAEIRMRQSKYLNNIVEQDHRAIKRLTRPMMGFKNFPCAKAIVAGIETMHMSHKGQMKSDTKPQALSVSEAKQFYSLPF